MLFACWNPGIAGGRICVVRRPPNLPETRCGAGRYIAQLIAWRIFTFARGWPGRLLRAQYDVTEVGFTKKRLLLTPNSSASAPAAADGTTGAPASVAAGADGTMGSRSAWPALTCRMLWFWSPPTVTTIRSGLAGRLP